MARLQSHGYGNGGCLVLDYVVSSEFYSCDCRKWQSSAAHSLHSTHVTGAGVSVSC